MVAPAEVFRSVAASDVESTRGQVHDTSTSRHASGTAGYCRVCAGSGTRAGRDDFGCGIGGTIRRTARRSSDPRRRTAGRGCEQYAPPHRHDQAWRDDGDDPGPEILRWRSDVRSSWSSPGNVQVRGCAATHYRNWVRRASPAHARSHSVECAWNCSYTWECPRMGPVLRWSPGFRSVVENRSRSTACAASSNARAA